MQELIDKYIFRRLNLKGDIYYTINVFLIEHAIVDIFDVKGFSMPDWIETNIDPKYEIRSVIGGKEYGFLREAERAEKDARNSK